MPFELIAEKAGEVVLSQAGKIISKAKETHQWKKLFIDTGEFFIKDFDRADSFLDELSLVMSEKSMQEMANDLKDANGFDFRNKLSSEIRKLMRSYEIPTDMADFYCHHFITVILSGIKDINPQKFEQIYLSDWRENEQKQLKEMQEQISLVVDNVSKAAQKKCRIFSVNDIEYELLSSTENPKIALDFFEIDDEGFKSEFERHIHDESMYIRTNCKEEGIYCILNELRKTEKERLIYIIKRESDWSILKELGYEGNIYIPWFYAEEIVSIPNNTNIFVLGPDEPCYGKLSIELRKRTRQNLRDALHKAGLSTRDATNLVDDTHGLYIPMKKKMLKGLYCKSPEWGGNDLEIVLAVLLCGKWTERDGDKAVVSDLSGHSYEECMRVVSKYGQGEDPLVLKVKERTGYKYCVASLENAWDCLDTKVTFDSTLWKRFSSLLKDVLTEPSPVFQFEIDGRVYKSVDSEHEFWSPDIRNGLLRSMIMKAFYKRSTHSQYVIDQIIKEILDSIDSVDKWMYISQYFRLLVEASPEEVLKKIEKEIEENSGLITLFRDSAKEGSLSDREYTEILWGVEQLLNQKRFAMRAAIWLIKMDRLDISYPVSNSPSEILKDILCPWIQLTVLSTQDRIKLATSLFEYNPKNAWNIVFAVLPGQKMSVVGEFSRPKYRDSDEHDVLLRKDVYDLYTEYVHLCLKYISCDLYRWKKMIREIDCVGGSLFDDIFMTLSDCIELMDDKERAKIKILLRKEIHRHRFYCSAEWALKEDKIKYFERYMNGIAISNPIYDYLYLFISDFDFPLLNPVPYEENDYSKLNEEAVEKERKTKLREFKNRKFSINELISILDNDTNTTGVVLAKYYSNNQFEMPIYEALLAAEKIDNAIEYVRFTYHGSEDDEILKKTIDIAKEQSIPSEYLASLYSIQKIMDPEKALIEKETDEEIISRYWKYTRYSVHTDEVARWTIYNSAKFSQFNEFIGILERNVKALSTHELLRILENVKHEDITQNDQMESYYLKKVLEVLQNEYLRAPEIIRVAKIELRMHNLLKWEDMVCLKKCLSQDPDIYLSIVRIIYKSDHDELVDDDKRKLAQNLYGLYWNMKFCPGELDGCINENVLFSWIEKFKVGLYKQGQSSLYGFLLGGLLANSPVGTDGFYPCIPVRKAIEENYNDDLKTEYCVETFNQRGVHSPSAGRAEKELALMYKKNADGIRSLFPFTATIFDSLSDQYLHDAEEERKMAEDVD